MTGNACVVPKVSFLFPKLTLRGFPLWTWIMRKWSLRISGGMSARHEANETDYYLSYSGALDS
ncbi:hypothetical protein GGP41_009917 [Bipolaris sorokiniana]|uniref:Uncharacterized protein n=1 Tax=Cochliobolus sativus TaxID=45130 RepID=A0A8H6DUE5_COCSA|nr:hypothetical protein GGP41_009917 [Bipolaris sorokiniana]